MTIGFCCVILCLWVSVLVEKTNLLFFKPRVGLNDLRPWLLVPWNGTKWHLFPSLKVRRSRKDKKHHRVPTKQLRLYPNKFNDAKNDPDLDFDIPKGSVCPSGSDKPKTKPRSLSLIDLN
ncbi:hypothetical protein QVD17_20255 [Tagetes erecta]|uniref:Uncharacterized protein n=1 Tax=Tagetes erecta TaxID=13708 RepID=A0AAD8KLF1_TARER|nr:hypothetical protein QVD17_20255 [Tagetes erecta]